MLHGASVPDVLLDSAQEVYGGTYAKYGLGADRSWQLNCLPPEWQTSLISGSAPR